MSFSPSIYPTNPVTNAWIFPKFFLRIDGFENLRLFESAILKRNLYLTDGIFVTGAYGVPSKSQNPIVLVHLVPNVQTLAGIVGTIRLAQMREKMFKS